ARLAGRASDGQDAAGLHRRRADLPRTDCPRLGLRAGDDVRDLPPWTVAAGRDLELLLDRGRPRRRRDRGGRRPQRRAPLGTPSPAGGARAQRLLRAENDQPHLGHAHPAARSPEHRLPRHESACKRRRPVIAPTEETVFELPVAGGEIVGHRGGSGAPALVLHGGPGLPDYMAGCAAELADLFSTIRYAQRGVPPTTVGPPYSVDTHVADAVAVLDGLGIERVWATGHSWGGHLALHLAVAHPERVEGVVCVCPLGASLEVLAEFKENLLRPLPTERRAWLAEVEAREDAGTATKAESLASFEAIWPSYFADPAGAPPFPFDAYGDGNPETFASIGEHVERRTLED